MAGFWVFAAFQYVGHGFAVGNAPEVFALVVAGGYPVVQGVTVGGCVAAVNEPHACG